MPARHLDGVAASGSSRLRDGAEILVSGALAYDRIMSFPGRFADHILPERVHMLSVCFQIERVTERFGGTAGNIAYSLALLGLRPLLHSAAGRDFGPYAEHLERLGLDLPGVTRLADQDTACAHITTDRGDNQITAFCRAAMDTPGTLPPEWIRPGSLAIVSAGNFGDMRSLPRILRERGAQFVMDPGQNVNCFTKQELFDMIAGSRVLVVNDYELSLVLRITGLDEAGLLELTRGLVVTLGEQGSVVHETERTVRIPAVPARRVLDPTGAGDAYRAGMLAGLARGLDLPDSCRLGSACASFAVETRGGQEHAFDFARVAKRLHRAFGPVFPDGAPGIASCEHETSPKEPT